MNSSISTIRDISATYLSGWKDLCQFQTNSSCTNLQAIVTIASYFTIILPALALITYATSSCCLSGRVTLKNNNEETKKNNDKPKFPKM